MSQNPLVNLLFLPLILIALILIKTGQITNKLLIFTVKLIFTGLSALSHLKFHFPKIRLPTINNQQKPTRRKTAPFATFYFKKLHQSWNWKMTVGLGAVFLLIYSLTLIKLAASLPSPNQISNSNNPLTTQIYDRSGKLLYQFYEGRNRKLVKLADLPKILIQATIAMEDKNFYRHPGIDLGGILRAVKNNWQSEDGLQGGSTITQQLIKNTMLTPDKTYVRKMKEIILSLWAEKVYTKDQILQSYFNEVPYGGPAWGIEAASEMYFGKSAHDLTLAEAAFLTGLTAAPTEYSPYGTHPEKARERQREVLRRMVEEKFLSLSQADEAFNQKLTLKPPTQDIKAPHFVMYVREVLANKYGERVVSQGGLKVMTSLDLDLQQMAEVVVADNVQKLDNLRVGNGAAMITDAKSGQILAMVGSRDYFSNDGGNFNVALALRQPGSSIKPITYATAFKLGYTPGTILLDAPTTFKNAWESYSPVNYDGKFHGAVSIRTALGSSYNVPAVKMLALVGIPAMLQTARDLGITTLDKPDQYGLSLTLGGGAVKLIDMMSVYNSFATGGLKYAPQAVLLVSDSSGNILEDNRHPEGKRALPEEVAYLISHILSDKNARRPAFGVNSGLEIKDHPSVAVKTGTSDDKRDNWAFGFTPEYVVGAWVGNNDNSPMDPRLTSGITGATPIWHDLMTNLLQDRPNLAFQRPASIIETETGGTRDLSLNGLQPKTTVSYSKVKQKDKETGAEKEVTAYSDPFSSFIPEITPKANN